LKRLMIFIDNSNIFLGSKKGGPNEEAINVDYPKLANFLSTSAIESYDLNRVLMYCALDVSKSEAEINYQRSIYNNFNSYLNFDVTVFDLKIARDKITGQVKDKYEKGVDVALATDLLVLAAKNAYDVAIVCAGDADFIRAIEGVKDMGKQIYVASFEKSCSWRLKQAALGYINLTENIDKIKK
jgi:uncharacterized LabA/DUF88 family protein